MAVTGFEILFLLFESQITQALKCWILKPVLVVETMDLVECSMHRKNDLEPLYSNLNLMRVSYRLIYNITCRIKELKAIEWNSYETFVPPKDVKSFEESFGICKRESFNFRDEMRSRFVWSFNLCFNVQKLIWSSNVIFVVSVAQKKPYCWRSPVKYADGLIGLHVSRSHVRRDWNSHEKRKQKKQTLSNGRLKRNRFEIIHWKERK